MSDRGLPFGVFRGMNWAVNQIAINSIYKKLRTNSCRLLAGCEKLPTGVDFTNSFIYDVAMSKREKMNPKAKVVPEGLEHLSNDATTVRSRLKSRK